MKGDSTLIKALNEVLAGELAAINQYFLHARMCKHWGYEKLGAYLYKESIDEMKHAQTLIDRILFLDGLPNIQKLGAISIGQTVAEQFDADLALELVAIPRLKSAIELALQVKDHVTRDMLESILASEEEHVDWLETQIALVKELGRENYLSQQLS